MSGGLNAVPVTVMMTGVGASERMITSSFGTVLLPENEMGCDTTAVVQSVPLGFENSFNSQRTCAHISYANAFKGNHAANGGIRILQP